MTDLTTAILYLSCIIAAAVLREEVSGDESKSDVILAAAGIALFVLGVAGTIGMMWRLR